MVMVLKFRARLLGFVLVICVGGCDVGCVMGVAGLIVSVMVSTILVLVMYVKCDVFTNFSQGFVGRFDVAIG